MNKGSRVQALTQCAMAVGAENGRSRDAVANLPAETAASVHSAAHENCRKYYYLAVAEEKDVVMDSLSTQSINVIQGSLQ